MGGVHKRVVVGTDNIMGAACRGHAVDGATAHRPRSTLPAIGFCAAGHAGGQVATDGNVLTTATC